MAARSAAPLNRGLDSRSALPVPASSAASAFQRLGLRTRGLWFVAARPQYAALSPAARFRNALEELGGLYAAFGQFLSWRADLLPSDYLNSFRRLRWRAPAISRVELARRLGAELGQKGGLLARELEPEPCWSTFSRCAYRTKFRDRTVVVQLACAPPSDAAFADFEKGLGLLDEDATRDATAPAALSQFRQWVRLSDSLARERSFLETLSRDQQSGLVEYPLLVPELTTENLLCWGWVDGETVSGLLSRGDVEPVQKVAEAVLEQLCLRSVLDAELDLETMVVTEAGRVAVRRANRLVAVPPALGRTALQYVSAVLAENSPLAAHLLLKLAGTDAPIELEARLRDQLSSLEPELKGKLRFPRSASVFEANWRALAQIGVPRPLFVDCLHRNLVAVGYWNAEVDSSQDCIPAGQWPVLGRLLRTRLDDLLSREAATHWLLGSGLLFFEGLRQMNRLADEFRDNDLSLTVDPPAEPEDQSRTANRTVRFGILAGMLFVVFLVCLRSAPVVSQPLATALAAVAVLAAAGLFWTVSRMG